MFNNRSRQQLSQGSGDIGIESLFKPYQDDPVDEEHIKTQSNTDIPLPHYEPMHDYLRRQNAARFMTTVDETSSSIMSRPFSGPTSSDPREPFLIDFWVDPEVPPPSYDDLHNSHDFELHSLRGFFMHARGDGVSMEEEEDEQQDEEEDTGLQFEDLVKWVLVMLMISLMVAFIGTLFDWGRSPQHIKDIRKHS